MNGRHGIEQAFPPGVAECAAEIADGFRGEPVGHFRLDALHSSGDITNHPWPPVRMKVVKYPHSGRRPRTLPDQAAVSATTESLNSQVFAPNFMPFNNVLFQRHVLEVAQIWVGLVLDRLTARPGVNAEQLDERLRVER